MLNIINNNTDPYLNMAIEEYLLKSFRTNETLVMLWQNSPAIIIGKNQNTLEEINVNYTKENNIAVVRRLSGGGAVYHDIGNLNFTFITDYDTAFFDSLDVFTKPVTEVLRELGITAELRGRNDISIDGKKFSGNSQVVSGNRMLHHGTIMLEVNTEILSKALKVSEAKIESKGIKSVRKRVTNINSILSSPITPSDFASLFRKYISREQKLTDYLFNETDTELIRQLRDKKYATDEWNYGLSPAFTFSKQLHLASGLIRFSFSTEKSIITKAGITGDFFGSADISELEDHLVGTPFTKEALLKRLSDIDTEKYIWSFKKTELPKIINLLFE